MELKPVIADGAREEIETIIPSEPWDSAGRSTVAIVSLTAVSSIAEV